MTPDKPQPNLKGKYCQLGRELEELPLTSDQKSNATHTFYKLGFLLEELIGSAWRKAHLKPKAEPKETTK